MSEQAQSIFTKVKNHLLNQKARCYVGEKCRYRGDQGLKCAVGCLISDEHYSPELEDKLFENSNIVCEAVEKSQGIEILHHKTWKLLVELQHMHDDIPPERWPEYLKDIAEQNGVEYE